MKDYTVIRKNTSVGKFIEFVGKALDNPNHRELFSYVYIDGKKIVATDGRRLHIYENEMFEELKDGQYNLDISNKNAVFTFTGNDNSDELPWRKALKPADSLKYTASINLGYKNLYRNSVDIGKLFHETGKTLDLSFIRDICGYTWDVHSGEKDNDIVFFYNDKFKISAYIMPMMKY